jgi:hypothetical protein
LPMIFPSLGSSKPRAALNNWDINHQTIKKTLISQPKGYYLINRGILNMSSSDPMNYDYFESLSFFFGCLPTSPGVTSWCHHLFGGP